MAAQTPQPLDGQVINRLRELDVDGDEMPFLVELFHSYFEGMEARLESLESAAAQADFAQIERVAHTLKGSSANLGAGEAASLCTEIERGARKGDLDAARRAANALRGVMERLHHLVSELPEFSGTAGPPWPTSGGRA